MHPLLSNLLKSSPIVLSPHFKGNVFIARFLAPRVREFYFREVSPFVQGHTASKRQSEHLIPGSLVPYEFATKPWVHQLSQTQNGQMTVLHLVCKCGSTYLPPHWRKTAFRWEAGKSTLWIITFKSTYRKKELFDGCQALGRGWGRRKVNVAIKKQPRGPSGNGNALYLVYTNTWSYKLNVCVPKFICWNLILNMMELGGWPLGSH